MITENEHVRVSRSRDGDLLFDHNLFSCALFLLLKPDLSPCQRCRISVIGSTIREAIPKGLFSNPVAGFGVSNFLPTFAQSFPIVVLHVGDEGVPLCIIESLAKCNQSL